MFALIIDAAKKHGESKSKRDQLRAMLEGGTMAAMDTGKVEMRKAPGAKKAEEALSTAAEFIPFVGAGRSAMEGNYGDAAMQGLLDVAPVGKAVGLAAPALMGVIGKNLKNNLYDLSGLPQKGVALIRSKADELAGMLRSNGFNVEVQHSGSAAGPSSYLRVFDPETGRFLQDPIRLSGHSKGAFNSAGVWNVTNDQFSDVMTAAERMRDKGPTQLMTENANQLQVAQEIRLKSAQKKLAKGKSLTNSERDVAMKFGLLNDGQLKDVLPAAERQANLEKFLEESAVKTPLYHATPQDFSVFKPGGDNTKLSGPAIWMSPSKEFQPAAHNIRKIPNEQNKMYGNQSNKFSPGTNVMPVHASIKNPLITTDKTWKEDFQKFGGGSPWTLTQDEVDKIKDVHDGIMYYDKDGILSEVIAFEPTQIKSALGNVGSFNPKDPDITKAKGGEVHAANGLPLTFAQDKEDPDALQNWMRERQFGKVDIPAPYKVTPEEVTVARAMKAAPAAPVDEVTQGEYGPRERLRELLQKGLGKGMSKSGAARSADILTDAASFVAPPMWGYEGGQSLGRAYDAVKQGDYGTAAIEGGLGALNLLPALPGAKVMGRAAGRAAKDVSPAAREVLHDALHSGMESGLIQGPAYVFIGPKAKTFDKKAAKQFEKMEAAGAPLNETWQEARTFRSPDQMLRQEVGDEPSRLKRERQYDLEVEFGDVKKRIAAEEDRLNELRQSGQISPEEFDAQMDQVVGPLLGARADIAMEYGKTGKMSGPVREHALKYPTLSKVMYHPELFKAYPSLKTVRAGYGVDKNLESIKGYFSPSQNRMYAESNYTPLTRNILLHEIQHAIQGIEGFGRGSNVSRSISEMLPPDMSENDLIDQLRRSIANMKNRQSEIIDIVGDNKNIYSNDLYKPLALEHINLTKTIEDSNKAIEDIIQQGNSHRIYLRSAGEAEARAAQKRWNMTPEERAATHPLESYDVPLDQLIVKR
jgi:hypothetical protein